MKSEHRHELQRSEIDKWVEAGGKFFESYGKILIISLVAVVVVTIGAIWLFTRGNSTKEAATGQLITATETKDYLTIADNPDYGDLATKAFARLRVGEKQLVSGIKLYIESTEAGKTELKKAQDNIKQALDSDKLLPDVRERALYKYAVAVESLSGRDTSKAVAAYKAVLSEFPESKYKKIVDERIAMLQTDEAKEFYAFLSTYQRKPADLKKPNDQGTFDPHKGRHVFKEEKPVELPRERDMPVGLLRYLDDPPKKKDGPKLPKMNKKKDSASPFPPAPKKGKGSKTGKKTGAKTKAGKFPPKKTPAKP